MLWAPFVVPDAVKTPPSAPSNPSNPSTATSVARNLWPHPLSALYRLTRINSHPSIQYEYTLRFVEGVGRFLFWTCLLDALSQDPTDEEAAAWMLRAARPGIGTNFELVGTLTKWLKERDSDGPFIAELPKLVSTRVWKRIRQTYTPERNDIAHNRFHLPPAHAKPLLEKERPILAELLVELHFLRHYHLGSVLRKTQQTFETWRVHWSPARGQVEVGSEVSLDTSNQGQWIADVPLLLDVPRQRGLLLSPFLRLDDQEHPPALIWLSGISMTRDKLANGRYRHPTRDHATQSNADEPKKKKGEGKGTSASGDVQWVMGFPPLFPNPENPTMKVHEWVASRAKQTHRFSLELTDESQQTLREGRGPTLFDERYQGLSLIGEGGSSMVYAAHDTTLDRAVVLKQMKSSFLADQNARVRFIKEARALVDLNHPRWVTCYEVLTHLDPPIIVMEHVEGQTLRERVRTRGPLTLEEAVASVCQVLDALEYLHGKNMVHRDIKPSNVIVDAEGHAHLIDLGIYKDMDANSPFTGIHTDTRLGTRPYMAIEQWMGKEVDPRSDQCGVAGLLFFLCCGRDPQAVDVVGPKPAEALKKGMPAVAPALDRIHARANALSPDERFPSARAMREALERMGDGSAEAAELEAAVADKQRDPIPDSVAKKLNALDASWKTMLEPETRMMLDQVKKIWQATSQVNTEEVDFTVVAMGLWKAVEREFNRSIFQLIRQRHGVPMPAYFDRFHPESGDLTVDLEGNPFNLNDATPGPGEGIQYPSLGMGPRLLLSEAGRGGANSLAEELRVIGELEVGQLLWTVAKLTKLRNMGSHAKSLKDTDYYQVKTLVDSLLRNFVTIKAHLAGVDTFQAQQQGEQTSTEERSAEAAIPTTEANDIDTLVVECFPQPVAVSWKRALEATSPDEKTRALFGTLQTMLRVLFVFHMADYLRVAPLKEVRQIQRLTPGSTAALIAKLNKRLMERGDPPPFLPALSREVLGSISRVVEERHRILFFGQMVAPASVLHEAGARIQRDMHAIFRDLDWMAEYKVVWVRSWRQKSLRRWEGTRVAFAGINPDPRRETVHLNPSLEQGRVYLWHPGKTGALDITSMVLAYRPETAISEKLFLFQRIDRRAQEMVLSNVETGECIRATVDWGETMSFIDFCLSAPHPDLYVDLTDSDRL